MSDIPVYVLVIALVVMLLLSAFFSASETALMAVNRYRLTHRAKAGSRGARMALALLKRPDQLISLILLFNNIVQALIPMALLVIADRLTGDPELAVIIATAATALLIFV